MSSSWRGISNGRSIRTAYSTRGRPSEAGRLAIVPAMGQGNPTLLIGSRKGAWVFSGDEQRGTWTSNGPMFLGQIIQHLVLDPRDRTTLLAASRTGHLGPTVFRSGDLGRTWKESSRPPAFAAGYRLQRSLNSVFWLSPGHGDAPEVCDA